MKITCENLTCEYLSNPVGIDSKQPLLGWIVKSEKRNTLQRAYQIKVAATKEDLEKGGRLLWDTERIESDQSQYVEYAGLPLESRRRYYWNVKVWDNHGNESDVSETAFFEMGLLQQRDWVAKWIEPEQVPTKEEPFMPFREAVNFKGCDLEDIELHPCQMIRKDFFVDKEVIKARIYATAHGVYKLELDGKKIGDIEFAPDYTSYHKYLQYQTYDITTFLNKGPHAIGAVVADGWYTGRIGMTGDSCQYGNTLGLLLQMDIEYSDGTKTIVATDGGFKSSTGPWVYSDIFIGERYDATLEKDGWSCAGYPDRDWKAVNEVQYPFDNLVAQYGEPVRVCEKIDPVEIFISPKGETIIDFGQVMAGRVVFSVEGDAGTVIKLEHCEILDQQKNFLNNILGRYKNQTDIYVCRGQGAETYEPSFTFHGFRYVKISGYPGEVRKENFTAHVLYSGMKKTGQFSCSDERINQLQHNILWSQMGNMLSIPTDCPQRERAGWTGDAQIFAATACYNMNVAPFFKRWLKNVQKDQTPDGQIPIVVPYVKAYYPGPGVGRDTHTSAGWGDVATILPWTLYNAYGDKKILEENYGMMAKWVEYIRRTAENDNPENIPGEMREERREKLKYIWNAHFHFGDWLTPSVSFNFETGEINFIQSAIRTMNIVPTCFYAYSTELMTKIAAELGKEEDAAYYKGLNDKVKEAFAYEYVDQNGYIRTELQGVYVLALKLGLIPAHLQKNAFDRLVQMIQDNGNKLDTGFLSVPFLLDVLKDGDRMDLAYNLLFQDECPSWLYEVKMGATTIWEAWQAVLPDGRPTMASYNHYAFGCVGDWMYRVIGGLHTSEPGYKKIMIKPEMDERITSASAMLESPYGQIESTWEIKESKMRLKVAIPANTTAEIYLPAANIGYAFMDNISVSSCTGIQEAVQFGDKVKVLVGSGIYEFNYVMNK